MCDTVKTKEKLCREKVAQQEQSMRPTQTAMRAFESRVRGCDRRTGAMSALSGIDYCDVI